MLFIYCNCLANATVTESFERDFSTLLTHGSSGVDFIWSTITVFVYVGILKMLLIFLTQKGNPMHLPLKRFKKYVLIGTIKTRFILVLLTCVIPLSSMHLNIRIKFK